MILGLGYILEWPVENGADSNLKRALGIPNGSPLLPGGMGYPPVKREGDLRTASKIYFLNQVSASVFYEP